MKINQGIALLFILFSVSSCVKKNNSCQCEVFGQKHRTSVHTNSYFKARKECKQYESPGVKCRIKLF